VVTASEKIPAAAQAFGLGLQALTDTGLARFDPSTLNWTVPPGVKLPDAGTTVAVKVTVCPKSVGLDEEVTEVVVLTLFTVRVKSCVAFGKTPLEAVILMG
jgi:hypothetical protein